MNESRLNDEDLVSLNLNFVRVENGNLNVKDVKNLKDDFQLSIVEENEQKTVRQKVKAVIHSNRFHLILVALVKFLSYLKFTA